MIVTCLRCQKPGQIAVEDEDGDRVEGEDVRVQVDGHTLWFYLCADCMTDEEAVDGLRRSTVAFLNTADETISSLEMVMERIPSMREDAEIRQTLDDMKAKRQNAQETLDKLMRGEMP